MPESWQAVLGILGGRDDDRPGDHGVVRAMEEPKAVIPADVVLPIERIHRNPGQPRTNFDQNALSELAESIRQHGLLHPVVVRPKDDNYEIIAGERRWRASQLAGLTEIQCRVLRGLDDETAFVLSVAENINRRDLDPIDEAKSYGASTRSTTLSKRWPACSANRPRPCNTDSTC